MVSKTEGKKILYLTTNYDKKFPTENYGHLTTNGKTTLYTLIKVILFDTYLHYLIDKYSVGAYLEVFVSGNFLNTYSLYKVYN